MEEARKPPITREAALRIALASRAMPNASLPALIQLLQRQLGEDIDEEKLRQTTVTMLKTGFASADGEEDGEDIGIGLEAMKLAVRIMWGETQGDDSLPKIESYEDGEMPGSVRVAIASDKGDLLSGHFAEDKNLWRAKLIGDCHVCYVVSIGGPAAAKVIRADIYPIKIPDGGPALDILQPFQVAMVESPPPWLLKILGVSAEKRLKNYSAAEIDE